MEGIGESNSLDFSFEELEFIDGGLEDLEDGAQDPNQLSAEEQKAADDKEAAEAEAAAQAAAQGEPAEDIDKEGTAEGDNPDAVSGSSTEGKGEGEDTSPKLYQTLADVLKEEGVLSSVDDSSLKEVKGVENLVELIKAQIKAEEYSDLDETQKTVLKDMREGVSADTAQQFKSAMDNLNSIDETLLKEDKQVRFDLIYQDFLAKGFAKDKASKMANRSFELKEDENDAKEAKASLIKAVQGRYNKATDAEKQAAKDKIAKIEKEKNDLKDLILKSDKVIEGVDAPEPLRKEVYENMVKTVSTDPETGEPENALMKYKRENPLEYNHKLYYLFSVTNGFKDMEYFKGKKTTSSVKALETALRQSTHVSGGGNPSFADDGNSHYLDIGELVLPED